MPSTDLVQDVQRLSSWVLASPSHVLISIAALIALLHVVPFLANSAAITIPGPVLAKFTDFWIVRQAMAGKRFIVVHELHRKYGES